MFLCLSRHLRISPCLSAICLYPSLPFCLPYGTCRRCASQGEAKGSLKCSDGFAAACEASAILQGCFESLASTLYIFESPSSRPPPPLLTAFLDGVQGSTHTHIMHVVRIACHMLKQHTHIHPTRLRGFAVAFSLIPTTPELIFL